MAAPVPEGLVPILLGPYSGRRGPVAAPLMALWGDVAMTGSPAAAAARHQARPEPVGAVPSLPPFLEGAGVTLF